MEKRAEINHSALKTPKKPQKAAGAMTVLNSSWQGGCFICSLSEQHLCKTHAEKNIGQNDEKRSENARE